MKFILCFILFFNSTIAKTQTNPPILLSNWEFQQEGTQKWFKASVPGSVHTDLWKNQLIPNPYTGDNELKIEWINTSNWNYRTHFDLDDIRFQQKHIDLYFEGLDTYADVYVNHQLIIEANNMHRQWMKNIKSILKKKGNLLFIKFYAAKKVVDSLAKNDLPLRIPDNSRLYARKAQYQFGWDFAPQYITCGIWRKVYIQCWSDIKISNLQLDSFQLRGKNAMVYFQSSIFADEEKTIPYSADIYNLGTDFSKQSSQTKIKQLLEKKGYSNQVYLKLNLKKGMNYILDSLLVNNAVLWQPHKKGKQQLYAIQVNFNQQIKCKTIGLRTIELITKPDSISDFSELNSKTGTGFYFKVNGEPVYITGANYVPMDMFPGSVSQKRYKEMIRAAKEANMNMLRIWGGGIYEDDYFYELCDEAGIMIWQDFMFAGSMVPTNTSFYENVKIEAEENVQRLRHHPSIALWCGNNEIDEAWHNWGWQKQFNLSATDSIQLWKSYESIFKILFKDVVKHHSPSTHYWSSSPSIGWGRKESLLKGDCHYWGVWWGLEPIEKYKEKVPRFMSEYGMQSMPNWESIVQFSKPKDWDTASIVMKLHQKHPTGYANLGIYLKRMFDKKISKNFKEYCNQTQLLQAKAYEIAIKAHKNAQPYNMGTLLWQLNEPWPAATWSIIDYYGNRKKAYFTVQKIYK